MIGCRIKRIHINYPVPCIRNEHNITHFKFLGLFSENFSINSHGLHRVDPVFVPGEPFKDLIPEFLIAMELIESCFAVLHTLIDDSSQFFPLQLESY